MVSSKSSDHNFQSRKKTMQKTKKFAEQVQTTPEQLTLFSLFVDSPNEYGHTLELYDFIPKYVFGKPKLIHSRFLESIERSFECRKKKYHVRITPGRIKGSDGRDRDSFLGLREELIEVALRKMAADGRYAKTLHLDGQLSVLFSRYSLQQLLKEMGHSYSYTQIEESIKTLFSVQIELRSEDGEISDNFHPVQAYGFRGKDDEEITYVKFCPLVTSSIENNAFRLANFKTLMKCKTAIARQLHKRMSHNFTQAANNETYHISVETMYRDFGLERRKPSSMLSQVKKGLKELEDLNVIKGYSVAPVLDAGRKNRKIDHVIKITPHESFIGDVVKANSDKKKRDQHLNMMKYLPDMLGPKGFGKTKG